jgi:hypothetical protein
MKKMVLSILIPLAGCSLLTREYYRGQAIDYSPVSEEKCRETHSLKYQREWSLDDKQRVQKSETPSSPLDISRQDGKRLSQCTRKIRINGKEQEVDSKEIIRRWL